MTQIVFLQFQVRVQELVDCSDTGTGRGDCYRILVHVLVVASVGNTNSMESIWHAGIGIPQYLPTGTGSSHSILLQVQVALTPVHYRMPWEFSTLTDPD